MIEIEPFLSFTIAVLLLIIGKILTLRWSFLRRYSIPAPVAGGLAFTALVTLLRAFFGIELHFQLAARDFLLLLFFAGIGLNSDIAALREGGKPLVILVVISAVFMLVQNIAGVGMALAFGRDALEGLLVGSVSLTGGVGTTAAWAPIFTEKGVSAAMELGVAANTVGLISACLIGGPMAAWLMARNRIAPSEDETLVIGTAHEAHPPLDYVAVLWAILMLHVTIMLGLVFHDAITAAGVTLPAFVSCLVAGIILRTLMPKAASRRVVRQWPGTHQAMALISDLALGLFLTMALMDLRLWALAGMLGFVVSALAVQIALAITFTAFAVFPLMGRDYEAAVVSSGFSGISLGSTATAIANMTAVAEQYGAAPRAFLVVPLVCGFFIDIANALVISGFVRLFN